MGAARDARERKKRSLQRHVLWLSDLCQAGSSHHTAQGRTQACPACAALRLRVDALAQQVAALGTGPLPNPAHADMMESADENLDDTGGLSRYQPGVCG